MKNFLEIAQTPAVLDLQERKGSRGLYDSSGEGASALSEDEIRMITSRDSIYVATVSEDGWPYVQHRGGHAGFIKVLGPTTIGWAERTGNRQYLSTGNVSADGRIAMILVDYPSRTRLKILGHATYHADLSCELVDALGASDLRIDGAITIEIQATNWNCPKYITPRFTEVEVAQAIDHLQGRIAELEAENERLRTR
ncbi:MAG: pyridoxamine 5'-phosphate oxidase family protein [Actinomycetota bacterium]